MMDERTLNDLLECSVCLERLDTSSKVLPCQHTFCRKCLEEIVSSHSELRCPECRVLVDVEIKDLPPNVLLIRILEGIKSAAYVPTNHLHSNKALDQTSIQQPNDNCTQPIKHRVDNNNCSNLKEDVGNNSTRLNLITQQHLKVTTNKQIATVPHAIALYDFESSEIGDLVFKKGDKVLLRQRIDENWFVGECNGREGVFPINYVKIMVPITQPQCKALYDFDMMGSNEEEGCLTFKKGTIVNVIRRVDLNWAEGRIGTKIGIFPIAFVEMNSLGKLLMDTSIMKQQNALPIPTEHHPTNSVPSSSSSAGHHKNLPIVGETLNLTKNTSNVGENSVSINDSARTKNNRHWSNKTNLRGKEILQPDSTLSNAYIALYEYKPQKYDELELKKGSIYYVKERCQDGWLRGVNREQQCGVFPGNYVISLKNTVPSIPPSTGASVASNGASKHEKDPPELPPRSSGSSLSMWSKPIGQQVEAFFGKFTNKRSNQSAPTYSMDNPVFEDNSEGTTKRNTKFLVQPTHTRSGSCPSKLTQTEIARKDHTAFGSHRIKPVRERSSLQGMSHGTNTNSYHRKSHSLDAATIAAQISSYSSSKRAYPNNEKYKCVVPYPPNSEFELEMKEGDVVYVHKKRENGWYKGTHEKTGKVGLFPCSFVEPMS